MAFLVSTVINLRFHKSGGDSLPAEQLSALQGVPYTVGVRYEGDIGSICAVRDRH